MKTFITKCDICGKEFSQEEAKTEIQDLGIQTQANYYQTRAFVQVCKKHLTDKGITLLKYEQTKNQDTLEDKVIELLEELGFIRE